MVSISFFNAVEVLTKSLEHSYKHCSELCIKYIAYLHFIYFFFSGDFPLYVYFFDGAHVS